MADVENREPVPFADTPCDAGCGRDWYRRIEFTDARGQLCVRFVCKPHYEQYLREQS